MNKETIYSTRDWSYSEYLQLQDGEPLAKIGLKSTIESLMRNQKYDETLMLRDMYLFQKEIENGFSMATKNATRNPETIDTATIDFIYNCGLLYIQIRNAADEIMGINPNIVDETYNEFLSIDKEMLYFDNMDYLPDIYVTHDDIVKLNVPPNTHWWIGRYDEYLPSSYEGKKLTKDVFEPQYIPYVRLYEDGTYEFNVNLYEGMALMTGAWEINEQDETIVYLLKPTNVVTDVNFDRLELKRLSESKIVLQGVETIEFPGFATTSHGGDIYEKKDLDSSNSQKAIQYDSYGWPTLYIDFLNTIHWVESEWGGYLLLDDRIESTDSFALYDIDSDGTPELFIGNIVDGLYHIYTIKNNKVVYLDYILLGRIVIERNIETKENQTFIYSFSESDGGYFDIGRLEMEGNIIVFNIIFSEESWMEDSQIRKAFYIREKEVSRDIYEKELRDFVNSFEEAGRIESYEVDAYNDWASFYLGMEKLIDAIDDYIINNSMY